MDLKLLLPIAFASPDGVPLPHPHNFEAVRDLEYNNRPEHGLWCSPITSWSSEGAPAGTAWTDWCAKPDDVTGQPSVYHGKYTQFVGVEPLPHARIYLVETVDHLDRLVATFPLSLDHPMRRTAPDWAAMTAACWDAVYVSAAGLAANAERFVMVEPSLAGWDCPSVLWLRPTYKLTVP